jgi:hypothetical protein
MAKKCEHRGRLCSSGLQKVECKRRKKMYMELRLCLKYRACVVITQYIFQVILHKTNLFDNIYVTY